MDLFILRLLLLFFFSSWRQDKHSFCYHIPVYRNKSVFLVFSVTAASVYETIDAADNPVNTLELMYKEGGKSMDIYMDVSKGFDLSFHILCFSPTTYFESFNSMQLC